jgi:hypothetical protein
MGGLPVEPSPSSGSGLMLGFFPMPGQQLVKLGGQVIIDPTEHVGQPSLGIDVVHLGGDDQAVHERRPLAAAIRAGE